MKISNHLKLNKYLSMQTNAYKAFAKKRKTKTLTGIFFKTTEQVKPMNVKTFLTYKLDITWTKHYFIYSSILCITRVPHS